MADGAVSGWWARAVADAEAAKLLFEAKAFNVSIDRAYYAMFHAARAVLQSIDPALAIARTHRTIIARFNLHLVLERGMDQQVGRALKNTELSRLQADYLPDFKGRDEAAEIIVDMEMFMTTLATFLGTTYP